MESNQSISETYEPCYARKHHFSSSSSVLAVWILQSLAVTDGSITSKNTCNVGTTCFNRLHWSLHLRSRLGDPRTFGKNRYPSKSHHHHQTGNDWAGHQTQQAMISGWVPVMDRAETQNGRTARSLENHWTKQPQNKTSQSNTHSHLSWTGFGALLSARGFAEHSINTHDHS